MAHFTSLCSLPPRYRGLVEYLVNPRFLGRDLRTMSCIHTRGPFMLFLSSRCFLRISGTGPRLSPTRPHPPPSDSSNMRRILSSRRRTRLKDAFFVVPFSSTSGGDDARAPSPWSNRQWFTPSAVQQSGELAINFVFQVGTGNLDMDQAYAMRAFDPRQSRRLTHGAVTGTPFKVESQRGTRIPPERPNTIWAQAERQNKADRTSPGSEGLGVLT